MADDFAQDLPDFEPVRPSEEEEEKESTAEKKFIGAHKSSFRDFLLKPELERAIADNAFEHPSDVQHECIPKAVAKTDIICQAKSGMGKTAVFVISILEQIQKVHEGVQAVVVCHTRELAFQVCQEFIRFSKYMDYITCKVYVGKYPIEDQVEELRGGQPSVIVGTPGRLFDLIERRALKVNTVQFFVVDECDHVLLESRMLDQLDKIYSRLPKVKQVMMFSATMDDDLRKKATTYMKAPMTVTVQAEELCLAGLELYEVELKENEKNEKLTALLDELEFNQVVIFVSSQRRCDALQKLMCDSWNFPAIAIHGNMPQPTRTTNFRKFKNGDSRFLVATDLMGRGIDVEGVNVVVNYDMPPDAHQFLHRIGRAGRFGTKGLAVSFLSSPEDKKVMEEVRQKFGVTVESLPEEIDPSTYMSTS